MANQQMTAVLCTPLPKRRKKIGWGERNLHCRYRYIKTDKEVCQSLPVIKWAALRENVSSSICGQRRLPTPYPRSLVRAFAVRLQNHCTLQNASIESKCPDETLRMRWMNLNLCILRMLEDTCSLGAAQMKIKQVSSSSTIERRTQIPTGRNFPVGT